MSGHSHFATIKRKKEAADQKRGAVFSKLVRLIQVAAKRDPNPDTNPALRMTIDKAREASMPQENIERAIKKAIGNEEGASLEEVTLEGFGPAGSAFLIDVITDNRNRTHSEIRRIFTERGGRLGERGSAGWMFQPKARFIIGTSDLNDNVQLELIDAGCEDFGKSDNATVALTSPDQMAGAIERAKKLGLTVSGQELFWYAKELVSVDETARKTVEQLVEALENHDDVKAVATNIA